MFAFVCRSLFPRQNPSSIVSWEDDDEPDMNPSRLFTGCLHLESLRLHSDKITPSIVVELTRALPMLKHLALPYCFNRLMSVSQKQVLWEGELVGVFSYG